ncbi:MAG: type IV secretory system conjugative DNA transfer family protein, partial [Pseudomonadota bacterium]
MARRRIDHAEVAKTRTAFWSGVIGGGIGAVGSHVLAPAFAGDDLVRLCLVIAFFTCLGTLTWSFTTPYADFLRADQRWRHEEASPAILHNVELYVSRMARFAAGPAWIATAGVTMAFLWVLAHWPIGEPLRPLLLPLKWGWVGCLAAVPLIAIATSRHLREATALRRAITEQLEASGFEPRSDKDVAEEARAADRPAVEATGALSFQAGGYEWHWSDFYKNAAIFGQSGSGKTVCVLNAVLDGLLASAAKSGAPPAGLILDPKGDFRTKIAMLLRQYGWERQLAMIDPADPSRSERWNPIDSSDSPIELAGRFGGVLETLSESGDKDRYFIDTAMTFLRHMIVILRSAHPDRPPNLSEIYDCASSDEVLIETGKGMPDTVGIEEERAIAYMKREWMSLADDTKSVVRSYLSNMMGPFLTPPYDSLFAGKSTLQIGKAIDEGRLIYVHLPLAEAEVMARVVATFVKLEFYREVLRRPDKARPSFFLCDEFQAFFTVGSGRGDADAFERTRQSNHANIIAFQNLNALYK